MALSQGLLLISMVVFTECKSLIIVDGLGAQCYSAPIILRKISMIKSKIIHPELLGILAKCGHKTQILIADANYSFVTNSSDSTEIIYLNFAKDMLPATAVLSGIVELINVESTAMMAWPQDFDNTIQSEYLNILEDGVEMNLLERADFYSAVKSDDTLLVVATGETRRFANLLLTVGPVIS